MNSPRVTVGVPVCNGETEIEACLACLSNQTFRDLAIVVFDNASTDRTAEIVAAAMRADSRISYVRHETNIGAQANFTAVLAAATSPYFMWRAYDDLSDPAYVERLVAALDAHPHAVLAAPRVVTLRRLAGRQRVRLPPESGTGPRTRLPAERWMIRRLQAGWVYGLFRREFLNDTKAFIDREYSYAWAWDFLLLATTALRAEIVGVPNATITLQLTGAPKQYSSSEVTAERVVLARNYWRVIELLIAEKKMSLYQRFLHRAIFVRHVKRRVAKWPILVRAMRDSLYRVPE
ncbi:MAG: glycosyltransferase family 2 protein [Sulfuricaulis sp.]|nr:glycosyltransferase family 2 protein [Sulfuricaulis sp.]